MNEKPTAKSNRPYVVLEDRELGELVRSFLDESDLRTGIDSTSLLAALDGVHVYHEVLRADARNSEHALRQAGEIIDTGTPDLIPVPVRYFRSSPVAASDRRHVEIG